MWKDNQMHGNFERRLFWQLREALTCTWNSLFSWCVHYTQLWWFEAVNQKFLLFCCDLQIFIMILLIKGAWGREMPPFPLPPPQKKPAQMIMCIQTHNTNNVQWACMNGTSSCNPYGFKECYCVNHSYIKIKDTTCGTESKALCIWKKTTQFLFSS